MHRRCCLLVTRMRCHQQVASPVHYTTSCKHNLVLLCCMPCGISVLRSPSRLDFNPWLTSHAPALLIVWLYSDIVPYGCCCMPCGISALVSPSRFDFNPRLTSHAPALLIVWLYSDIVPYGCCCMPCGISALVSPSRLDFNPRLTSHAPAFLTVWLYSDIVPYGCCARTLPGRVTLTTTFAPCTRAGATLDPPYIADTNSFLRAFWYESVRPEHNAALCILFAEINLGKPIDRVNSATTKAPKSAARLGHFVWMQHLRMGEIIARNMLSWLLLSIKFVIVASSWLFILLSFYLYFLYFPVDLGENSVWKISK